jgi:hypothetical protein
VRRQRDVEQGAVNVEEDSDLAWINGIKFHELSRNKNCSAAPGRERTKRRNFVQDLARRREVETLFKKRANKLVVSFEIGR